MIRRLLKVLAGYDTPPVLTWPSGGPARSCEVEFSIDAFRNVLFSSSAHLPELTAHEYSIPDWDWRKAPWFGKIYWRVVTATEHGRTELYSGSIRRLTCKRMLQLLVNILRAAWTFGARRIPGNGIRGIEYRPEYWPTGGPQLSSLNDLPRRPQLARGYFRNVFWKDGRLEGSGWMLLPETRIDGIDVFVNTAYTATVPVLFHEEHLDEFSFIPHYMHSLFHFSVEREYQFPDIPIEVCLLGFSKGRYVCGMETTYCPEWESMVVFPPQHLMKRVANNEDVVFFKTSAMKSYWDYFRTAARFISLEIGDKVMDWGCGVGRMLGLASRVHPEWKFYGCDVDREAITWCRSNIKNVVFDVAPLMPPTQYPDNTFSLVIANSVLTHLDRNTQMEWLSEIRRIMAPNGLFLASLHGEFSYRFLTKKREEHKSSHRLRAEGIIDHMKDPAHSGVTPDGYYRATFQSKDYSVGLFSRYFSVLEYMERGAMNLQDLVVLRKEPSNGKLHKTVLSDRPRTP